MPGDRSDFGRRAAFHPVQRRGANRAYVRAGDGSNYADAVQPGEAAEIELPLGRYHLVRNSHRKVFVATGTGLAPFLPMFEQMAAGELATAELYFGCRTQAENITAAFANLLPTIVCVSRGQAAPGGFHGRVTQALAGMEFDP